MGPVILLVGLAVAGVFFALLERWRPAVEGQRRSGVGTDVAYWFVTPLLIKPVTRLAIVVALVCAAAAAGAPLTREGLSTFLAPRGPVQTLPSWAQILLFLLLADLLGYLAHRLLHSRYLWPVHAIHHSSTDVDWLSAVRMHPLNDVVTRVIQATPLVLFGFDASFLVGYVPALIFVSLLQHANVSWDFGPLRYLVVSPAFHRWHHAEAALGRERNFSGLFPVWDLLFGTLHLPSKPGPDRFGVSDADIPDRFFGQLLYPLRRRS